MSHKKLIFYLLLSICVISELAYSQGVLSNRKIEYTDIDDIIWRGAEIKCLKNQLIVKIKEDGMSNEISSYLIKSNAYLIPIVEKWKLFQIKYEKNVNIIEQANMAKESGFFEFVEPNYLIRTCATYPNEDYFNLQWHLHNVGQSGGTADADVDAPEAWDLEKGSETVKIAILDTGIQTDVYGGELTHPDLDDGLKYSLGGDYSGIAGWGDDPDGIVRDLGGHGTHVAGIVAALTNNDEGVSGITWNCKLHIIQIIDEYGRWGSAIGFIRGIDEAINTPDVRVINFSGQLFWQQGGDPPDTTAIPEAVKEAIAMADEANILCVFAAGNGGSVKFPASLATDPELNNVIAVSATNDNDNFAAYSSHGSQVTVCAPGGSGGSYDSDDIYSTVPTYYYHMIGDVGTYTYGYMHGTSMAAPVVSGIAALVWSANNELDDKEVKDIIIDSAEDKGAVGWDQYYGFGRVNAYGAVLLAGGCGEITYDMHWYKDCNLTAGYAYLYVDPGVTLTIDPGVVVTFNGDCASDYSRLSVLGKLVANGTSGSG